MEHGLFSRARVALTLLFFVDKDEKKAGHRRIINSASYLCSLHPSSVLLPAAMTTTSSSSGLTFKLHPVSERQTKEERGLRERGIGKTIFPSHLVRRSHLLFLPSLSHVPPPQQQNNNNNNKQLVVVNISDHVTRAKVSSSSSGVDEAAATACVAGCLLGSVGAATRTVDVANSFELVVASPGAQPDAALLRRRLDQCEFFFSEKRIGERGETTTFFLSTDAFSSFLENPKLKKKKKKNSKKKKTQTSRRSRRSTSSDGTPLACSPSPPAGPGPPRR